MRIGIMIMRVLEVIFFTGLAGCLVVVAISWVVILKASFSKDTPK